MITTVGFTCHTVACLAYEYIRHRIPHRSECDSVGILQTTSLAGLLGTVVTEKAFELCEQHPVALLPAYQHALGTILNEIT